MKMICLGSGSSGNNYIFRASNNETLIVECGVPFKEIKKGLNWNLKSVVGCIVSHEHADHSLCLKDMCDVGIDCYALQCIGESKGVLTSTFFHQIKPMTGYKIGNFKVFTLPVLHDVPCLAFVISHDEMGKTLFVTDTMMLEYKVSGLNHIMLECNYSDSALEKAIQDERTHEAMKARLLNTHMELDTTVGILKANDLTKVNEIVLVHLSGRNSDEVEFIRRAKETSGKAVYVAKKGLELDFSLMPY